MSLHPNQFRKFLLGFKHAFEGIVYTVSSQLNMKIHLVAAFIAIVLSFTLDIPKTQVAIVLLSISMVLTLEMVNTAIERVVDLVTTEYHPLAKVAKDVAAGAVLIAAFFALLIGLIVFINPIMEYIKPILGLD